MNISGFLILIHFSCNLYEVRLCCYLDFKIRILSKSAGLLSSNM